MPDWSITLKSDFDEETYEYSGPIADLLDHLSDVVDPDHITVIKVVRTDV